MTAVIREDPAAAARRWLAVRAMITIDPEAAARQWLESLHPREPGGRGKRGGQFIKKMKEFLDSPLEENTGGGLKLAPMESMDPPEVARLSPGARAIYDARLKRGFEQPVALKLAQNWEEEQKPKPKPAPPAWTLPPGVPVPPGEERELTGKALWASGEGVVTPTPAETQAAADIWYGTRYTHTNAQLRYGSVPDAGPAFTSDVAGFEGLINRSPAFTQWAEMYRGAGHGIHEFGEPGTAVGKTFTDKGFVSITSDYFTAQDYSQGATVNMHIPPGTHAYHADQVTWTAAGNTSAYPLSSVQEYTLPPGCRFVVIGDRGSGTTPGDPRVLDVVVLPPLPAAAAAAVARTVLVAAAAGPGLPGGQRFGWLPGELEDTGVTHAARWNPELHPRDRKGRFGHGGVPGRVRPATNKPTMGAQDLLNNINEEARASEDKGDHKVALFLTMAGQVIEEGRTGTNWRTQAADYLKQAADEAERAGGDERHQRDAEWFRYLAGHATRLPDESPRSIQVTKLMKKAAPVLPSLVGGGHERWNGKLDVFSQDEHPEWAGFLSRDGTIHLNQRTATGITDTLNSDKADDTDAWDVLLHEMMHGVRDGRQEKAIKAWEALPDDKRRAMLAFNFLDEENSSRGEVATSHTLSELEHQPVVHGGVSQEQVDALVKDGLVVRGQGTANGEGSWFLSAKAREMLPEWRDTQSTDNNAYADSEAAKVEEGFNELGTVMHLPDFTRRVGVGDKKTGNLLIGQAAPPTFSKQALYDSQQELRDLYDRQGKLGGPGSLKVYDALNDVLHETWAEKVRPGFISSKLAEAEAAEQDPAMKRDIHKLRVKLGVAGEAYKTATLSQFADQVNDPTLISTGQATGHYPGYTASALSWVQAVDRAEHLGAWDGRKGTKAWARVTELADQVNREDTAGKLRVMTRQVYEANGIDPDKVPGWDMTDIQTTIKNEWHRGGEAAFKAASALARTQKPMMPASAYMHAAAGDDAPLGDALTKAGAEAFRIRDWAWKDPKTRLPDALAKLAKLADGATPAELREIQDAGRMLARLADGQGVEASDNRVIVPLTVAAGFNPWQPRDADGKWRLFHGTTKHFRPGDLILPSSQVPEAERTRTYRPSSPDHVYATPDMGLAAFYAGMRDNPEPEKPGDDRYSVYQVEPTGPVERDPQHAPDRPDPDHYDEEPTYRSRRPLRVIRRVPWSHESIRDAQHEPASWTIPPPAQTRAAFDEAKHPRLPGGHGRKSGEFTKTPGGGGKVEPLTAFGNVTPENSGRMNKLLAKPGPGRPALPPYEESVARVSKELTDLIAKQDTMDAGRSWYADEHKQAVARAKKYGVSVEVAAGVEAATSPRTHYLVNQQVTDKLLAYVPKSGKTADEIIASRQMNGLIMTHFLNDGIRIAAGEDIGKSLTGAKRRAFFDNITWPGQTDQVTVDTWMLRALGALGLDPEQQQALGAERRVPFREGLGRLIVADALRDASKRLRAQGIDAGPDAVQAAYWIAAQKREGFKSPTGRGHAVLKAAAMDDAEPFELLTDDQFDAEVLLEYLGWRAEDIPDRIDLGVPGSATPDILLAANNDAAWPIVMADPRWEPLGLSLAQAKAITGGRS